MTKCMTSNNSMCSNGAIKTDRHGNQSDTK